MNSRTGGTAGDGAGLGEYGSLWAKQYHKIGLFQLSELSLQALAFQSEHVAVGGVTGALELSVGPGQGHLERDTPLGPCPFLGGQVGLTCHRSPGILLLRFNRLAFPTSRHTSPYYGLRSLKRRGLNFEL